MNGQLGKTGKWIIGTVQIEDMYGVRHMMFWLLIHSSWPEYSISKSWVKFTLKYGRNMSRVNFQMTNRKTNYQSSTVLAHLIPDTYIRCISSVHMHMYMWVWHFNVLETSRKCKKKCENFVNDYIIFKRHWENNRLIWYDCYVYYMWWDIK